MDCLFCKIIEGKIPSARVFDDENTIVIRDIQPQAKEHFLVIPKKHFANIAEAFADEVAGRKVAADLFAAANRFVRQNGMYPAGYRSVLNTGEFGGQTVSHLHLHLLGGEKLHGRFA